MDDVAVLALNGNQAGVDQFSLGDDDDVKPRRDLVTTKNLSYESFSSISHDGAAEAPRRSDAQSADIEPGCSHEYGR